MDQPSDDGKRLQQASVKAAPRAPEESSGASGSDAELRLIGRVLPFLWPKGESGARIRVVTALAFLVLAKLAVVITPFFYRDAVDALTAAPETGGAVPGGQAALIVVPLGLILAYCVAGFASVGFTQLRDIVFARVGQRALRRLAISVFEHLHNLPLAYHLGRKTGALSRIIDRGVKAIDFLLRFLLFSIVPLMIELLLVAVIFLSEFGLWYFITITTAIALYILFTFRITAWRLKIRQRMNRSDQEAAQKAVDSLLNFETVKIFGAERRESERYDISMQRYEADAVLTQRSLGLLNAGQRLIISGALFIVMLMAARDVVSGALSVGAFVMVNAYMLQLSAPLGFLGTVYREIRQALIDMQQLFEVLDTRPDIRDAPDARPFTARAGRIEFRDVHFGYDPRRQILRGLSFTVEPGQMVAIVGASGAGKSTISRLLMRFYDVTGGAILIDGRDIRDIRREELRRAMSIAPQDPVLFNDTVRYNLAYARPEASEAEMRAAAERAFIGSFIDAMPAGYDTVVGERGLRLSGGEKQRLSLARAILHDSPILVLDEATSALDSHSERWIRDAIGALRGKKAMLVIAHRLSTIADADHTLVIGSGGIREQGAHEALIRAGGEYADMWKRQLAGQAPSGGGERL